MILSEVCAANLGPFYLNDEICYAKEMKISLETLPEFVSKFLKNEVLKYQNNQSALLIEFSGNLGAGKTTFTQYLARELKIEEKITSPTFVLMKKYSINFGQFKTLVHIDAYRVESSDEISILNFPELLSNPENLILLEWPEKISDILPEQKITITLEVVDDEREINILNKTNA